MRVVALLAVRNEALYLPVCLGHLAAQGVETCVIDNGSTDDSRAIAESFRDRGVFRIVDHPYSGFLDWTGILRLKEQLACTIEADWFIHHDADEIRETPSPWRTLAEGVEAMDSAGWNAINFDEFVFVPTNELQSYDGTDYVLGMQYYYFFEPAQLHRVNAWKRQPVAVDLVSTGGHRVAFPDRRIAPEAFVLRHYIFLSREHCLRKYVKQRAYSKQEVDAGWHGWRARLADVNVRLPTLSEMKQVESGTWDKSEPCRSHRFLQNIS